MKINDFQGDLTDISADKEALHPMFHSKEGLQSPCSYEDEGIIFLHAVVLDLAPIR